MAQGEGGHQGLLLLKVQPDELAVVFLGDAGRLEHVIVQLPLAVRRVQHQERHQKHSLIPALEVLQELFGFRAVGGEVGRDDVHVVPRADRLFLLVDLGPVQVGDLPLHRLDGADLVHGLDVQVDDQAAFHVQKVRQHPVIQLRGQDLQERGRAVQLPHAEHPPILELEGAGGDEVLGGQAGGGQPVPGEAERFLSVHVEDAVEQTQALYPVHGGGGHAQPLEVVDYVDLNALQPGLGGLDAVRVDAEGEVFGLGQAVVPLGKLVLQHLRVFIPDIVELVRPHGNDDAPGTVLGGGQVQKGELEADGAVEVVEEIGPALEDGGLVLVLAELVVDVLELHRLGVESIGDAANAVRVHPLIGDAVLGGQLLFVVSFCPGDSGLNVPPVLVGQVPTAFSPGRSGLGVRLSPEPISDGRDKQCDTPPDLICPAAPGRHRSCWFCRGAAWGAGSRR